MEVIQGKTFFWIEDIVFFRRVGGSCKDNIQVNCDFYKIMN